MTSKRHLRARVRGSGIAAGSVLVDWLNCEGSYRGKKRTLAHRRIEEFLSEWHSLASVPKSHWQNEDWSRLSELQKRLSRYRMSPQIDEKRMGNSGMRFVWNPGPS